MGVLLAWGVDGCCDGDDELLHALDDEADEDGLDDQLAVGDGVDEVAGGFHVVHLYQVEHVPQQSEEARLAVVSRPVEILHHLLPRQLLPQPLAPQPRKNLPQQLYHQPHALDHL